MQYPDINDCWIFFLMTEIFPNFQVLSKNRWWTRAQIFLQSDADKWLIFADSTEDEGANPFSKSWVVGDNNREDTNSTIHLIVTISDAYLLLSSRVIEKEKEFFSWLTSQQNSSGRVKPFAHEKLRGKSFIPKESKYQWIFGAFVIKSSYSTPVASENFWSLYQRRRRQVITCFSAKHRRRAKNWYRITIIFPRCSSTQRGKKFHPYFLKEIEDVTMISFLAPFGFSMLPLSMEYGVFAEHIWSVLCV